VIHVSSKAVVSQLNKHSHPLSSSIWIALVSGLIMTTLADSGHAAELRPRPPSGPASITAPVGDGEDPRFDIALRRARAFRALDPSGARRLGQARPGSFDAEVYRDATLVTRATQLLVGGPTNPDAPAVALICAALFNRLGGKATVVSSKGRALSRTAMAESNVNNELATFIHMWLNDGNAAATPKEAVTPFNLIAPVTKLKADVSQMVRLVFTGEPLPADRESMFYFNMLEAPQKSNEEAQISLAVRTRIKVFPINAGNCTQSA